MPVIYNIGIRMYGAGLRLASLVNPKARQWINGRQNWRIRLHEGITALPSTPSRRIWIHCASVGEFEQGRPVIELLKKERPDLQVILTFFSPSGYELRKDYPLADLVAYLPLDTPHNARQFLDEVKPDLVVFVKYEFWVNFLHEVQKRRIPLLLVSGIFRKDQLFFRPGGNSFRKVLAGFSQLFIQNQASASLLDEIGISKYKVVGDTRADRVAAIARSAKSYELVEAFTGKSKVLVAGSTWPPDEKILAEVSTKEPGLSYKVILAPHEIKPAHLEELERLWPHSSVRFSLGRRDKVAEIDTLIIDNIGMLASLYRCGKVAYIGGGFGAGIHNVLEPVAFGIPVIFGPRFEKFEEARQLIACGAAFSVEDAESLQKVLQQLEDEEFYSRASDAGLAYVQENHGATAAIVEFMLEEGYLG